MSRNKINRRLAQFFLRPEFKAGAGCHADLKMKLPVDLHGKPMPTVSSLLVTAELNRFWVFYLPKSLAILFYHFNCRSMNKQDFEIHWPIREFPVEIELNCLDKESKIIKLRYTIYQKLDKSGMVVGFRGYCEKLETPEMKGEIQTRVHSGCRKAGGANCAFCRTTHCDF